jgi:Zn-dependent alcohol dehydrogenase
LARKLGATDLIDSRQVDAVGEVKSLTNGGADYVIETSGLAKVAETTFDMLGEGSTAVLVGLPPAHGTKISFDMTRFIPSEITVKGSHVGSLRPRIDLPRYCDMYLSGALNLESLVTHTYALEDINEGFSRIAEGANGRAIIQF